MAFDAVFLTAVLEELRQKIIGLRVEKIQQPARDTVILQLRGKEKLLLSLVEFPDHITCEVLDFVIEAVP